MEFSYTAVEGQIDGDFETGTGTVSLSAGLADNALDFTGTFGATFDENTLPGLVISDGVLQSFCLGMTSDVTLGPSGSALTLATAGLTFSYVSASLTLQIPSGTVSVTDSKGDFDFTGTFGTPATSTTSAIPGLVVTDGVLTGLDISVTSNITAGGLSLSVDDLIFEYNSTGNQYEIDTGDLSFDTSEGFSFTASFGLPDPTDPSTILPGLVVSGGGSRNSTHPSRRASRSPGWPSKSTAWR